MMRKKTKVAEPTVSIIIPCYNSEKTIGACLRSLLQQQTWIPYEIIVVDSSIDATPKIITQQFPEVKLIRREQKTIPSLGRNIGAEHAHGKFLAFIDSDCVADQDWLEKGVRDLERYAIVGGSVANGNPGLISWADFVLTFNEVLPSMPSREVSFMPSCNQFVRKDVFLTLGGFPAEVPIGEDTLFSHAAAKQYPLLFDPAVRVAHTNRVRLSKFLQHHQQFGQHSAQLRKQYDLPGKTLSRYPLLALSAPLVRMGRISWRMLRYNRKYLFPYIISSPLILLGTGAWSYGFIKGAWKK